MAIKKEILESGFIRTYSDANRFIEREDGVRFTEAVEREGSTHTYTETDEEIPPNPFAPKYSTLSIKRELAKIGKWELAKAMLEASGYWDDFVLANNLSEEDEVFKKASSEFVARGFATKTELDAMLAKCVWTAE